MSLLYSLLPLETIKGKDKREFTAEALGTKSSTLSTQPLLKPIGIQSQNQGTISLPF